MLVTTFQSIYVDNLKIVKKMIKMLDRFTHEGHLDAKQKS